MVHALISTLDHAKSASHHGLPRDKRGKHPCSDVTEQVICRWLVCDRSNQLFAVHAAPGGGKSRFLLEVARAPQAAEDSKCRAVIVAYNSGMDVVEELDSQYPEAGLALRVLYSCFLSSYSSYFSYSSSPITFQSFANWALDIFHGRPELTGMLTLSNAVQAVRNQCDKKHVFLGIDELVKTKDPQAILKAVGVSLNNFAWFASIVTTLDQLPVEKEQMKSNRPIKWLRLDPIDASKVFDESAYDVIKDIAAECGGHPRLLEYLQDIAGEFKGDIREEALTDVRVLLSARYLDGYNPVPLPVMRTALLGMNVNLDDQVPDMKSSLTYRECVECGMYLNSLDETNFADFRPWTSMLHVRIFAEQCLRSDDAYDRSVGAAAMKLLDLQMNFTWQNYEKFHAYWEHLRVLLRPAEARSLLQDYPRGLSSHAPDGKYYNPAQQAAPAFLQHQFTPKTIQRRTADGKEACLRERIVVPAANQAGFDLVRCVQFVDESERCLWINVELKYSDAEADTKFSAADVLDKWNLVRQVYDSHLNGTCQCVKQADGCCVHMGSTDNELVLVFIACRAAKGEVTCDQIPPNVIVLDKEAILTLYGPTFANRPIFQSAVSSN